MRKWSRAEMQFASCRYLPDLGVLAVSFRNGEQFQIPVETLLKNSARDANWERLRIGETQDVLEVPLAGSITEIPWDRVRCVADAEFRRHLANQAARSARRLGQRLRHLRLETGLTQEAVATAAGVARGTISRLENGLFQPTLQTLTRVLAAIGKRLQDLAPTEDVLFPPERRKNALKRS